MRSKVLIPIGLFLVILAVLTGIAIIVIQTHYFRQFVKLTTNSIVTSLTAQDFKIGSIEGNFLKGISLKNVTFDIDGERFITCDEVYIDYSLPIILDGSMLFSKVIPLHEVRVSGFTIHLVHYGGDSWNFTKLGERFIAKEKKPNPDWSIFIKSGFVENARMTIYDVPKNQHSVFELPGAEVAVNLVKITDNAEFVIKDAVFTAVPNIDKSERFYFDKINGKAVYSNKEKIDVLDVKRAFFNFRGARVNASGTMKNLMSPTFTLGGTIKNIDAGELGRLGVEVRARGASERWKGLQASGRLDVIDSVILGETLEGSIKKIRVENTSVTLTGGKLSSPFGKAAFDGTLGLYEITSPGKSNEADIKLSVDSASAARLLEIFDKTQSDGAPKELKKDVNARVDSRLAVRAGWKGKEPPALDVALESFRMNGLETGEITLSGPMKIRPDKIEFDLDTSSSKTNFANILTDFPNETDFNSKLHVKGSVVPGKKPPDGLELSVKGDISPSVIKGFKLDRGAVDLSFAPSSLDIRTLTLESGRLSAKASGSLGSGTESGVRYGVNAGDLGALSGLVPGDKLAGSLSVEGVVRGTFERPRLTVNARVADFASLKQKLTVEKIELSAETYLDLSDLQMKAKGGLKGIEIQGRAMEAADFDAESRGRELYGAVHVTEAPDRKYEAEYKASGLDTQEKLIEIPKIRLAFKDALFENKRPVSAVLKNGGIAVSSFNLYHKDNSAVGEITLGASGAIDGRLKLEKLDLADVSSLLRARFPIKGSVSGEIDLGGTVKAPTISATAAARDLEYKEFKGDELTLSLLHFGDDFELNLRIMDGGEEVLTALADAHMPMDPSGMERTLQKVRYTARVRSKGIDISPLMIFNPEIQGLEGKLVVDVTAAGSGGEPDISGTIELRDVAVDLLMLRNDIEIEHAVLDLDGAYGTLRPVTIKTGEGEGSFMGKIDFRDLSYSAKGTMNGMHVRTYPNDVTANLDGTIDVTGKFPASLIKGEITVNDLKAIVPEKPIKEIENIRFIDEDEGKDEFIYTGAAKEDFVQEFVSLDLDVNIPRQSWIKGSGANIEVQGRLDINKNYKEPYLITGSIDVIRGDYQFMGRLFNIESGTVSFRGKKIVDPFLDLRATYEVSSVEVYINVSGTAEKPRIQLTSDPPLEENEIVSYLVFGTSSEKLGTDERVQFQEKAGEVLGTMAVGELRQAIGDDLAIDVMTIKGSQTGFKDTHLEIGKYLTENFYIGYERFSYERFFYERYFLSPGLLSSTATANRAVIEYRVSDFLTLESEIGDEAGADVFFNFDY
ncbi:MAG TPA: translocation/assembly module TamB domain-containing protein [Thermodesulfobacteriota bacterium]|nr:translocation/assembly module TamB domain-containing protein [Thermodesulfobacteriota bacterium]